MNAVDAAVQETLTALTAAYGFALARDTPLLAIAFSGGLDSTVLLDAFARALAPSQLLALHVHHGLSPDADDWLRHAEHESQRRGVRFLAQRVDLRHLAGQGIEAAARVARYRALTQMAEQAGVPVLLVAQHADDQAETVLLQLLRGAGLPGVAAMPRERFADIVPHVSGEAECEAGSASASASESESVPLRLYRPFLDLTRAHLELYAARHGLNWINDESNQDVRFARNALRRDVLPQIDSYFPAYRQTLARFARHAAAAQSLCDDLAAMDWHRCVVGVGDADASLVGEGARTAPAAGAAVMSRNRLQTLSSDRLSNLLRYWIKQQALPAASAGRLAEMVRQLSEASSAAALADSLAHRIPRAHGRISIAHGGRVLHAYRDQVFWRDGDAKASASLGRADADALASQDTPPAYAGGPIWSLPRWRGELRVLDVAMDGAAPHDDDAIGSECPSAERSPDGRPAFVRVPRDWQRYGPLSARARVGGERLRLAADRPARSLKQHFQQAAVPAWLRDVPLFYIGEQLIFVPYVGGHWPFPSDTATAIADAHSETGLDELRLYWHPWGHRTRDTGD